MPGYCAHPSAATESKSTAALQNAASSSRAGTTSILESGDFSLASQIPDNGVTCATRRSQRVLDMVVPRERRDLVQFGASCAWRVGLAGIFKVPYIYLKQLSCKQSFIDLYLPLR